MTYSMTGIGEGRITENGFDLRVSIRSVNHRFLNVYIRMPRGYQNYETLVRDTITSRITRGKVDVTVDFYSVPEEAGQVIVNRGYGARMVEMIRVLARELDIPDGLNAERLARYPDLITTLPVEKDQNDSIANILSKACESALHAFLVSRRREGDMLVHDMKQRIDRLGQMIESIETYAKEQPNIVKTRLESALAKLNAETSINQDRLKDEVMLWAVRCDITEETVRFRSHLQRLTTLLDSIESGGKELDFLLQELHREITTTGSKSVVTEVSQLVISVKVEVEKLREQAQNLE